MSRENIQFSSMGNGITVWDKNRTRNGDYLTVAHISYDRKVELYAKVSPDAKLQIENFAKYCNSHPVSQPDMLALRPIQGSAFMSQDEKDCYLRDNDCSADGVKRFLQEKWDDTKTPPENLKMFRIWWNDKIVNEYL